MNDTTRFYDAHRFPLRAIFTFAARIEASGTGRMPQSGGVVLISNHLSMLDPLVLGVLFPRQLFFMAKEELFAFKPLGWWLEHAGTFSVRRGESDRAALRRSEELLLAGEVVMIFPEGHRSGTGGAQAAQAGALMLAARTNCPILPVGLAGTEKLRPKGPPGQSRLSPLTWPRVQVRVGEPIRVDPHARGAARRKASENLMRSIVSLLPRTYHGVFSEDS